MDPEPGTIKWKKGAKQPEKSKVVEKKKTKPVVVKKKRSKLPPDDTKLLSTHSGLRTLFRRAGGKYGNTRVSQSAIDKLKSERSAEMSAADVLHVIDIANKIASGNNRKTVLESDVESSLYAIKICSQ